MAGKENKCKKARNPPAYYAGYFGWTAPKAAARKAFQLYRRLRDMEKKSHEVAAKAAMECAEANDRRLAGGQSKPQLLVAAELTRMLAARARKVSEEDGENAA